MYAKGGHGFGMRKQNLPTDHWIDRFADWLELARLVEEVTTARCVLNMLHPATYSISRWLDDYNFNRPHGSLGYAPPISRAAATCTTS